MPRRLIAVVAGLLAVALLAGCGRDVPPVPGTESIAADDRGEALAVAGPTLDGPTLALADLRGRVVVLNNWASWCAPCRDETPTLVDLATTSDPADVAVVGLNVTDEPDAARAFVDEFAMPYPSIVDPEGRILAGIPGVPPSALPSTVVLDRQGRVAARIIGAVDPVELTTLVTSLAAETSPSEGAG